MFHKKFLFISLFLFAAQSFADTDCIDLSGDYQCSFPMSENEFTDIGVSVTQTVNSDQHPVITLQLTAPNGAQQTHEYVANQEPQNGNIAVCHPDSFQIISHYDNTYLRISVHHLTPEGNMQIDNLIGTMQQDEAGNSGIGIVGDQGSLTCTRN